MRGLRFLGNRRVEIREFPKPKAKDSNVVVKIEASALCGTDLPFYRAKKDILGCIPGHELAGKVVEIDQTSYIKIGDRVVLNTQIGCGRCDYCRGGKVLFCESVKTMGVTPGFDGGHADYVLVPEKDCLLLPDDIDYTIGSVIPDGVGVPYNVFEKIGLRGREEIAVFGCGPIGLGIILLGKFWGAKVIGIDINPYRLDLSKKLGADKVIDASKNNPVTLIKEMTDNKGVSKAIDCAGNTDVTTNQTLYSVKKGGKVVFVGEKENVNFRNVREQIIHRELKIYGSCGYNLSNYGKLVSLIQEGLPVEKLITHKFLFEEADKAYREFEQGKTGKVVLIRK